MQTLTDLLRHLDPRERMERRRRINAIADWWALKLRQKYGSKGEALAACRKHQVATAKRGDALRNHIWALASRKL